MITGRTILAGVMGFPVSHSRSPRLHNFWLARHRIDGAYVPLPTPPEKFDVAVRGLRAAGFAGVNVTIPHKEAAFALCDTLDAGARRIGAVNTLVFSESGIFGCNTDGYGFLQNLAAHGVLPDGPALLLGAGGAARAIAAALLGEGAQVTIANRSRERAISLCEDLPGLRMIPWEQRDAALENHALLVNTTSLGMLNNRPLVMDFGRASQGLAVADIVYAPLETPLLAQARQAGFVTVPGLGMLLHQAVPGFAAWFGVTPRVDDEVLAVLSAPA